MDGVKVVVAVGKYTRVGAVGVIVISLVWVTVIVKVGKVVVGRWFRAASMGKPRIYSGIVPRTDIDQNVADFSLRRVWVFHLDCHNIMHR